MTGKSYYITTLGEWQRHAARFANSHFIALDSGFVAPASPPANLCGPTVDEDRQRDAGATNNLASESDAGSAQHRQDLAPGTACCAPTEETSAQVNADAKILVLIEADEGVHLALEGEPAFEALPHPLAQKPISGAAQSALASHGVAPGATTFDAAEAVARVHPLLRHRVF